MPATACRNVIQHDQYVAMEKYYVYHLYAQNYIAQKQNLKYFRRPQTIIDIIFLYICMTLLRNFFTPSVYIMVSMTCISHVQSQCLLTRRSLFQFEAAH